MSTCSSGRGQPQFRGDLGGQLTVDPRELRHHRRTDLGHFHLAEFEGERRDNVFGFHSRHALPEHPRLAVVILKGLGALAHGLPVDALGVVPEHVLVGQGWAAAADAVLVVAGPALRDRVLPVTIVLVGPDLGHRTVDRQLGEVGAAQPDQLGVQVGEVAELQQRIVGEVDAGHHVRRVKRDLLGLGEEVVRVAVQHHLAHGSNRNLFFGNDFRRVEQIEIEVELVLLGHELNPEFPFRVLARLDGLPQVAAVVVGVFAGDLWHSSQISECTPSRGFQWNFTKVPSPRSFTSRKVCTPKPCIMR